ncbi:MAG: tetratricopeptide repeat protein [Bacteroidota bacterium]
MDKHGVTAQKTEGNVLSTANEIQFGNFFIDGCAERMKGNFKESKKLFESCLKIDPKNHATYYELAILYKMLGAPNEALINAKLCASADQQNEWYQMLLAECFVANRQYQNAIKVRENLIRRFPKKNELKEALAYEYSVIGQQEKALSLYDELEKSMGINEQITQNKLRILKTIKNYKRAEQELLKLIASDNAQIRNYNDLADLYIETKQTEKAKEVYDKILLLDPNNPTVYLALHDYHVNKGNDAEALKDLQKAVENQYLDVTIKTQIIEDYYKRAEHGNPNAFIDGLMLVKLAVKTHPNAMPINALCGDFYRLDKNNKNAAYYYYKAASVDKNNYRLWQNLLITENDMGVFDSLAKHAAQALEIFPNQPVFYLYGGIANAALKQYQVAAQNLKDGLDLSVGNKRLMIDFLSAAGDNYFQMKEYGNSDNSFEQALKLDADNTFVLNNYAYYLSLRNTNLELAEKLSRRANELKPNNANYMDTYAWIFFKEKKYSQALQLISEAVKLSQSATVIEHYGDILYFSDKFDEAFLQWNKSKVAGNKSEVLSKKIKDKKWYE